MKETEVKLGQLVLSTQGRDKGVLAIVVEKVDDKFVKIADLHCFSPMLYYGLGGRKSVIRF